MTDMYRQLQVKDPRSEGRSSAVAESLAAAMRDMLKQTPTLDPAIWAPFAVYVAGN